jgi:hypothetical protein
MLRAYDSAMLWLFQSDAFGAEAQRTETMMNNLADIEERLQNHQSHFARVDRDGWLIESATKSRSDRARRSTGVRQTLGRAIVHCGEWLQGRQDVEPATFEGSSSQAR